MTASDTDTRGQEEFELALKYEKGDGVEKDLFEAAEHLQTAASLNHTGAMVKLGKAYQCGCGVMKDIDKAMELFKQAESMGDTDGMMELGHCYEKGVGVTSDPDEAMRLYTKAADKGTLQKGIWLSNKRHMCRFK